MPAYPVKKLSTAYDVARAAGVSQSTVSRAFTPGASISAAARAKVNSAAEMLSYRPNLIARSLITRRSNIIGLALAHVDNEFYSMLLAALNEEFALSGRRLLLFSGDPFGDSDPMLSEILKYQVDAIILASTTLSSSLAEDCRAAGIPIILINRTSAAKGVSTVTGDNVAGSRQIAEFLLRGEHSRLAFVAGTENSSTSRERQEAFVHRVVSAGRLEPLIEPGNYQADATREAVRKLLKLPDPPDGIFCANDLMAFAAIEVARFEFGLAVGRDISIVGFDNIRSAASPSWSLTTYSQSVDRMAKAALALIESDHETEEHERVAGDLIVRSSARIPTIDR